MRWLMDHSITNKVRTVAIIDDNIDDIALLTRSLQRDKDRCYKIEGFLSLGEGLNALSQDHFDVYIIDYDLAGESGFGLLSEAQSKSLTQPLIMLTGSANPAIGRKALELGATDFAQKNELAANQLTRLIDHAMIRKSHELRLTYAANHDFLTGLLQKHHFEQEANRAIARHLREEKQLALCLLDLDSFKPVNDRFGHAVGDRVLKSIGLRLQKFFRNNDLVGRLGGDEFGILLENISAQTDVDQIMKSLRKAISAPIKADQHWVSVQLSAGHSIFPTDSASYTQLIQIADRRMYQEKPDSVRNAKLPSTV